MEKEVEVGVITDASHTLKGALLLSSSLSRQHGPKWLHPKARFLQTPAHRMGTRRCGVITVREMEEEAEVERGRWRWR